MSQSGLFSYTNVKNLPRILRENGKVTICDRSCVVWHGYWWKQGHSLALNASEKRFLFKWQFGLDCWCSFHCVIYSYIAGFRSCADNRCFCFFLGQRGQNKPCVPIDMWGVSLRVGMCVWGGIPEGKRSLLFQSSGVGVRVSSSTREGPPYLIRAGGGLGWCLPWAGACGASQALSTDPEAGFGPVNPSGL